MYSHDSKLLYYTIQKSPDLQVIETYDLLTDQVVNKTNVPSLSPWSSHYLTELAPLLGNRVLFRLRQEPIHSLFFHR